MQPRVKSIGELCREGFYGADPHINSEGAGQVQVYRAAVQEKEQRKGRKQDGMHIHGETEAEQGGGDGVRQDYCQTQNGSLCRGKFHLVFCRQI